MSQFPLMAVHLAAIWSDLGSGECLSSHSWLSTTRRSDQVWGVVNVSVPTHGCPPRGDLIRSREWWLSQFPLMAVDDAAIWSGLGSGEYLSSHSWLSTSRRSDQVWGVVNVSVPTHGCRRRGDLIRSGEWWMSQFPPWLSTSRRSDQVWGVVNVSVPSHGCPPHGDLIRSGGGGSGGCLSFHSWLSTTRRSDQVWGVVDVSVPTHGSPPHGDLIRSGEWWMSQFHSWLSTTRRSDQVWGVVDVSVPTHGCRRRGDLIRSGGWWMSQFPLMAVHLMAIWSGLGGGGVVDVSVPTHGCRRLGDLIRSGEWWMSQFPLMAVHLMAIWSGLGSGGCLSSTHGCRRRGDLIRSGEWWMSQFPLMAVDDAAIWSGLGSGGCLSSHSWLSTSWRSDQVWGVVDVSVPLMAVHDAAIWSGLGSGGCLSSHSWLSTSWRSDQVWGVVNVSVPTHGCRRRGDLIRSGVWWMSQFPPMAVHLAAIWSGLWGEWWMSQFPPMAVDDAAIWSGLGVVNVCSHSWLSTTRRSDQVWGVVNVSVPTHGCRRRGDLIRSGGEWWMSQFPLMAVHDAAIWSGLGSGGCLSSHSWLSTTRRSDQVWGVVNVSVPTHGCPPRGDLIRSGGEWWMSQFPPMAVDDAAIWSGLGSGECLSSHSWLSTTRRSDQVWGVVNVSVPSHGCRRRGDLIRSGEWWMSQFPLMAVDDAAIWSGLGSGECLSSHSWLSTSWRSDQVWGVVNVSVPTHGCPPRGDLIRSGGSGGCLSSHSWLSTTRRSDQVWGVVNVSVPSHGCRRRGDLIRSGEWWMSQFPLMAVDDAAIWSGLGSGECLSSHSWLSTTRRSDQVWGVVNVSVPTHGSPPHGDLIRSGEWWMSQFPLMALHLMAIWSGLGSGECLSSHSWLSTTRGDLIRSGEWWMSQFPLMALHLMAIWSGLGSGECLSSHSWLSTTRRSDQVWGVVNVSVPTHGCRRRGDLIRSGEWWMSQFPLMAVHDAAIWSGLGSGGCLSSHSWLSTSWRSDQI